MSVGQKVKSRVVLIKDDFVLVCLKGEVKGQLAYLPAKRVSNSGYILMSLTQMHDLMP